MTRAGQRRDDDHHDPGGGRGEVAALDVVDDRVVQVDHAADADVAGRADQVEQHAGQAELAGQGHDERRQLQLGDDDALQRAVGRGGGERGEHRGPQRVAEREHPQRDDGAAGRGEAGGEVDLAEQQHEDLGHAERDDERRLCHQVDQVARRQEQRVLHLEDDHDDDQAHDDGQRAALARADTPADDPQVVAEVVGEQVGRRVRRGDDVGLGGGRRRRRRLLVHGRHCSALRAAALGSRCGDLAVGAGAGGHPVHRRVGVVVGHGPT